MGRPPLPSAFRPRPRDLRERTNQTATCRNETPAVAAGTCLANGAA